MYIHDTQTSVLKEIVAAREIIIIIPLKIVFNFYNILL